MRKGETHPWESSETVISAFRFYTASSQQALRAFVPVFIVQEVAVGATYFLEWVTVSGFPRRGHL